MRSEIDLLQTIHTPSLTDIRIELLRGCAVARAHCSAYASPGHPIQLPSERVLTLIDEFAEFGSRRVTFRGGEPLIYLQLSNILLGCDLIS
jgi:MoaA/NifB/PqqE/SkfB family radical SAM enzyme